MIVGGESRGQHRVDPDWQLDHEGKLTAAATSDGVGGILAATGLLCQFGLSHEQIDPVVDEWTMAWDNVDKQHVVVIGTGEVNIFALFLHRLVKGMFFGAHESWPLISSLRYRFEIKGLQPFLRINSECGFGVVALLKNPWNTKFRLLWIAGLSGLATTAGCSAVASNWSEHPNTVAESIGVNPLALYLM
jgi:hypothetical protein